MAEQRGPRGVQITLAVGAVLMLLGGVLAREPIDPNTGANLPRGLLGLYFLLAGVLTVLVALVILIVKSSRSSRS